MNIVREYVHFLLLGAAVAVGCLLTGCDNKETLLDVETPSGGVEVERSLDTGQVTVDVDERP